MSQYRKKPVVIEAHELRRLVDELEDRGNVVCPSAVPPSQVAMLAAADLIESQAARIEELEALADRNALAYIEASNPGIDMDRVKAERAARRALTEDTATVEANDDT
jgi:hypothetical protein